MIPQDRPVLCLGIVGTTLLPEQIRWIVSHAETHNNSVVEPYTDRLPAVAVVDMDTPGSQPPTHTGSAPDDNASDALPISVRDATAASGVFHADIAPPITLFQDVVDNDVVDGLLREPDL